MSEEMDFAQLVAQEYEIKLLMAKCAELEAKVAELEAENKRLRGHIEQLREAVEEGLSTYKVPKLTQSDGNVWHGWSGYGVGAGLENCDYGYSTEDREDVLRELWPESIAG